MEPQQNTDEGLTTGLTTGCDAGMHGNINNAKNEPTDTLESPSSSGGASEVNNAFGDPMEIGAKNEANNDDQERFIPPLVMEAASIALPPSEDPIDTVNSSKEEMDIKTTPTMQSQEDNPVTMAADGEEEKRTIEEPATSVQQEENYDTQKHEMQDEELAPATVKSVETKEDSTSLDSNLLQADQEEAQEIIPEVPWWYPKFRGRPVFYGTKEALGWLCTAVAQAAILIGVGAFILTAIAKLAKEEAGCETEAPSGEDLPDCQGRVYGIKPSSLLTLLSSVVGLASAFIIPPVGAVVDFTNHRRLIGRWVSVFYSLGILCMVFLSEETWLALAIVLTVSISIGWAQTMLMNAYLPEMTDDENRLNEFSKTFTVVIFCTMVLCLIVVMGIAVAFGFEEDDVALARCAAVVAFVISAFLFYASWWLLLEERMAMHELPQGQTLVGAGFRQVYRTAIMIWNQYRGLKWFYISICFGDAAIQSLSVIAISYTTDQLEFNSQEVAGAGLLLLLGSIPGAIVGAWVNKLFNPIRSSALAVFGMMVGTAIAAVVLTGPGLQYVTYAFSFLWGFGTGWKYTGDRVLAAGIVPAGQDAELMGFYMFAGQVFAWVPSLVYTLLNEAGVSQRIGLSTLCVVFLGALLSYCMMGDYSTAVGQADRLRVDSIPSVQQQQQKAKKGDLQSGTVPETVAP